MNSDLRIVASDTLRQFACGVFAYHGVSPGDAYRAADILVTADLRGIDSHGVARLPRYAELLAAGHLNPRPHIRTIRSSMTTATLDGDGGLGLIVGPVANQRAIAMAAEHGAGWVAVRGSSHFGIAGYYAMQAIEKDLIGWTMTNSGNLVAPFRGAERMLGTNPIAVAFPAGKEPPVVVDMATSTVAYGKIQVAAREEASLPEGWAIAADGSVASRPNEMIDGGALLPLGSTADGQGHKGYCLGAMVDLFCGVLSGAGWGPFGPHFAMHTASALGSRGSGTGHFFGALDIAGFSDPLSFKSRLDDWIQTMRNTRPAKGTQGPLIPGDPEQRSEVNRRRYGVPLLPVVYEKLIALSQDTGVAIV